MREKAVNALLWLAYACAVVLAWIGPWSEAAMRYLVRNDPGRLAQRAMRELDKLMQGWPFWFQILVIAIVGLPVTLGIIMAACIALLVTYLFTVLGNLAEDRWMPYLTVK